MNRTLLKICGRNVGGAASTQPSGHGTQGRMRRSRTACQPHCTMEVQSLLSTGTATLMNCGPDPRPGDVLPESKPPGETCYVSHWHRQTPAAYEHENYETNPNEKSQVSQLQHVVKNTSSSYDETNPNDPRTPTFVACSRSSGVPRMVTGNQRTPNAPTSLHHSLPPVGAAFFRDKTRPTRLNAHLHAPQGDTRKSVQAGQTQSNPVKVRFIKTYPTQSGRMTPREGLLRFTRQRPTLRGMAFGGRWR